MDSIDKIGKVAPAEPTRSSPAWIAMGAGLAGVLLGGVAVLLGLRGDGVIPGVMGASATGVTRGGTAIAEPADAVVEEQVLPAASSSLVEAVAHTRDTVVNIRTARRLGAGVIVDDAGVVVTNFHVIQDVLRSPREGLFGNQEAAQEVPLVVARFENGRELPAQVLVADRREDIAVLRLQPADTAESFASASLGRSAGLAVGQEVFAIGNPAGLSHTVSRGIVSALNRPDIVLDRKLPLIQLDASINIGNSGGPLFNLDGELVGIVAAHRRDAQGIAFALPIDHVRAFLRAAEAGDRTRAGMIGVSIELPDQLPQEVIERGYKAGLRVAKVYEGQPADAAGMKEDDTIVAIRGQRLDGLAEARSNPRLLADHFVLTVRALFPGETLKVTLMRGTEEVEVEVEVTAATARDQAVIDADELLGLRLKPQQDPPTVIGVRPGSPLAGYRGAREWLQNATITQVLGNQAKSLDELGGTLAQLRGLMRQRAADTYVVTGFRLQDGREIQLDLPVLPK